MPVFDPTPAPPAASVASRPHRAGPSLSRRLVWLTVVAVLVAEALIFLPSLARTRRDWLERKLREGQLAALAASVGQVQDATRTDLLRLAGVEAVVLREPARTIILARAGAQPDAGQRLDIARDTMAGAVAGAVGGLFRSGDVLLRVQGRSLLGDGAAVAVLVHRRDLDDVLAAYARHVGAISLSVAAIAGLLLYAALNRLLVRPLRRLTESLAAFRADPERAATFDPLESDDGEIAVAGRELAAMQRELRAALWRNARLAALGTAVAKISHDLRGILSPALLTAERLQMSQDASIKRAGDTLVRAVERATDLVRRTVEFAREIPVVPARQRMELRPVVVEAIEQARAACPALAVANEVPDALAIEADRASMVRVLANLLRNAGEAQARQARVSASEEGAEIVITVIDDGPGLPAQVQERLFRPFVSGGRPGSTGLGLAIVRDLMRAHGGEIGLVETGAAGTRFRLTLPRAARAPSRTDAAPRAVELPG